MTVTPVPGHVSTPAGHGRPPGRLARWAVGLSAVFGAAFAASAATIAIAYAVGGEGAIEDNWLGIALATMASVGLSGSLAGFVLAIIAAVRRQRWALLWLPLCVFPACLLFLLLGEAFWWE